jgi:hypothetical protein
LNKAVQDRLGKRRTKIGFFMQKEKIVILCIGTAGTAVGSRIPGPEKKRGGKQFCARHRRYVSIAMTNDYMTWQTCSTCFWRITHPKISKLIIRKL